MGKLNKKKQAKLKLDKTKTANKLSKKMKNLQKSGKNVEMNIDSTPVKTNTDIIGRFENVKQSRKMSLKGVSGNHILATDVTDIGIEELKTWGIEDKSSCRNPIDAKSKKGDAHKLKGRKRKIDRVQEKQEIKHKTKEDLKDVHDLKPKTISDMSSWKNLYVPDVVMEALADSGFTCPTPIQSLSLPSAIRDRMDIVGAAETGSGKTLAFGIPIIHNILEHKKKMLSHLRESEVNSDDNDDDSDEDSDPSDDLDVSCHNLKKSYKDNSGSDTSDDSSKSSDVDEEECSEKMETDTTKVVLDGGEEVSGANIEEIIGYNIDLDALKTDGDPCSDDEEYDLSPGEEEDNDDLSDDELGCVKVINDVEFDWLEKPKKMIAESNDVAPLIALILCPTRELAMQVTQHLKMVTKHTSIKIATVIGGMAVQKQERLLKKCPEIVVATPGRLWELIQDGQPHLAKVEFVRNLVIDEADRMVEKGHFQELTKLLDMINSNDEQRNQRQTFVFSATLTLAHSGPDRILLKKKKKQKFKKLNEKDKLDALMVQIGLKDKPKIIDLTRKQGTAETLVESRIVCDKNEKDIYLYYFKQQYKGRTLVFTNSKDCIRRLISILTLLECDPLPLHSDMHQTQRLKNLDRFKENKNGFLLATDVAARGLDIPDVQHVIHYQVPRTTENYIHRSGRTARASKEGLSVMLVSPEDMKNYRTIIKTLNRDEELPTFPFDLDYLPSLKENLSLALEIDKLEHTQVKLKKENSWFEKAAKEMDMDLDEDQLLHDMGDSHEQAGTKRKLKFMKMELKQMLKIPVMSRQFSGKYPTKSGRLVVPFMPDENKSAVMKVKADIQRTQTFLNEHINNIAKKEKQISKKKEKFLKKRKYFQNKTS